MCAWTIISASQKPWKLRNKNWNKTLFPYSLLLFVWFGFSLPLLSFSAQTPPQLNHLPPTTQPPYSTYSKNADHFTVWSAFFFGYSDAVLGAFSSAFISRIRSFRRSTPSWECRRHRKALQDIVSHIIQSQQLAGYRRHNAGYRIIDERRRTSKISRWASQEAMGIVGIAEGLGWP